MERGLLDRLEDRLPLAPPFLILAPGEERVLRPVARCLLRLEDIPLDRHTGDGEDLLLVGGDERPGAVRVGALVEASHHDPHPTVDASGELDRRQDLVTEVGERRRHLVGAADDGVDVLSHTKGHYPLDGIGTPEGLISVMTTNDIEVLDPALTRPGRVDYIEKVGLLDGAQLVEFVTRMWPGAVPTNELVEFIENPLTEVAPSTVVEAYKRHPHDAEKAMALIPILEEERCSTSSSPA